jgi:cytochrome c
MVLFPLRWAIVIPAVLSASKAWSQGNCGPVSNSEFRSVVLATRVSATLDEPLKMAFDQDAQGRVDVYFAERKGKVRKYEAATQQVVTLGTVPTSSTFEQGLSGIALDPAFHSNRWIYLFYAFGADPDFHFRVSRFTLSSQNQLDMASEKIVLSIPAVDARMHTGGAMQFDAQGNLWIGVGDNGSGEEGPSNTNDLRGKLLRIRPTPEGTYTIPGGNLFPPGTAKTRPEIFIMGSRNASIPKE